MSRPGLSTGIIAVKQHRVIGCLERDLKDIMVSITAGHRGLIMDFISEVCKYTHLYLQLQFCLLIIYQYYYTNTLGTLEDQETIKYEKNTSYFYPLLG